MFSVLYFDRENDGCFYDLFQWFYSSCGYEDMGIKVYIIIYLIFWLQMKCYMILFF